MTLAFTFSGGMAVEGPGTGLYEQYPVMRRWIDQVVDWTGIPLERLLCEDFTAPFYSGDLSGCPDLRLVAESRQAAYSIGIADVLADRGIRPSVIGGSSLGFMIGAALAGAIERPALFDYLRVKTAVPVNPEGQPPQAIAMYVVPLDEGPEGFVGEWPQIHFACELGKLIGDQTGMYMFSGHLDDIRAFAEAKPAGLISVLTPLGGAHSPLMRFHQEAVAPYVDEMTFRDPPVPVVSGLSDRILTTADDVRADWLRNPVTTTQITHVMSGLERAGSKLALALGVASGISMFSFPIPVYPVVAPEDFDVVGGLVYDAGIPLSHG